jgi:hypothetical protein
MGKIYVGQTALRFQLTTDVDITGALCQVKHKRPDGETATWSGIILNADTGIFYYDVQAGDLDLPGDWIMWAHVTFQDLTYAPGEPNTIEVYEEGK